MQSSLTLYNISNYTFNSKESLAELDHVPPSKQVDQLYQHYSAKGMKTSVEAVLMVHDHHHPNLLMVQNSGGVLSLPHGSLVMGEDETAGLKRILNSLLGASKISSPTDDWDIGEITSVLYRPNFETHWYPYLPCHITKPKEIKKTFVVYLAEKMTFNVPKNVKLIAVPFYEIHNNPKYGNHIAALSWILSGYNFLYEG